MSRIAWCVSGESPGTSPRAMAASTALREAAEASLSPVTFRAASM